MCSSDLRDDPMLLEFAAQYIYASNDAPQWDKYKEMYSIEKETI